MNFFSSDPFFEAMAEAGFSGRPFAPQSVSVEGRHFRVLTVDGRPVTSWPFLDFLEPADEPAPATAPRLPYLPMALRSEVPVDAWNGHRGPEVQPAPTIRWDTVADWPAFQAWVETKVSKRWADSKRRERRIERELGGPAQYLFHDEAPDALEKCFAWKSGQYLATGLKDLFADPRNVTLFRALVKKGVAPVSTMRAGGRLLAVHVAALWEGRFYSWLPAYDKDLSQLSPGRLLMEWLMAESFKRKHREFDFLIGDESYKWAYATHTRVLGPLGQAPLSMRLRAGTRRFVKRGLQKLPGVWEGSARFRQWLRQRT